MKRLLVLLMLWPTLAWGGNAFFLSKNGNDANTGKSWAAAKLTVAGVRDSIHYDDTLVFGQGTWYGAFFDIQSSSGDPTHVRVYACSSWYAYATSGGAVTLQQAIDSSRTSAGKFRTVLYSGMQLTSVTKIGTINGGADSLWQGSVSYPNTQGDYGSSAYVLSQSSTADGADSMLSKQSSLANVNQPGEWYVSGSTISFCPYNDISATGLSLIGTRTAVFYLSGQSADISYVKIWGLEMKGGAAAVVFFRSVDYGNTTDHVWIERCHIAMGAQVPTENPSCIGAYRADEPCSNRYSYIYILNDSLGWALQNGSGSAAPPWQNNTTTSDGSSGAGIKSYNADYWHVDSCTFYGFYSCGVHFKNDYHGSTSCSYGSRGNTVARSHIFNTGGIGIYEDTYPDHDSVYGCVIEGMARGIFYWRASYAAVDSLWAKQYFFFANNTFYGITESPFTSVGAEGEPCGIENEWAYNIAYNCTGTYKWDLSPQSTSGTCGNNTINYWTVDYNYWYGGSAFSARYDASTARNWTAWQAKGLDAHGSNTTNPNFDHPTDAGTMWYRFARSGSSPEISRYYGGRDWTLIGAVQPTTPATPACPVVTLVGPGDGVAIGHLPLTLTADITDANNDSCIVWIYGDQSNPPTTLIFQDTVSAPELNYAYVWNGLQNLQTYYYRDSVQDYPGCKVGSAVRSFSTDTAAVTTVFKIRGNIRGTIK